MKIRPLNLPGLLVAAMLIIPMAGKSQTSRLTDSLIAYYSFDDSTVTDKSGNGHNGTNHGTPTNVTGPNGHNAKHFNGSSSYISVPNNSQLMLGSGPEWSISFWYASDSPQVTKVQPLVAKMDLGTGSANADYYTFTQSGLFVWGTGNSSSSGAWLLTNCPSVKIWHHVIVTYKKGTSGGYKNIYVDGTLVKSGIATTKATSSADLYLGYSWDGNGKNYFKGSLDEVRIYNRELDTTDVRLLSWKTPTPPAPVVSYSLTDSLIAYYPFDDSTANDFSGHNFHGTFTGSPTIVSGMKGNARHFDGFHDLVRVSNAPLLELGKTGKNLSISLWFKNDSNYSKSGVQPMLAKMRAGTGSNEADYYLFNQGGKTVWGNGDAVDTGSWMQVNEPSLKHWHHLIATYQKGTDNFGTPCFFKNLYLDGSLISSTIGYSKAITTEDLTIAYSWDGNGKNFFKGTLDEIRLYNRLLDTSDVRKLNIVIPPTPHYIVQGNVSTSTGAPLKNSQIGFITYNPADTTMSTISLCITDSNGHYLFDRTDSTTTGYLLAVGDSVLYANQFPTYYDSALFLLDGKVVKFNQSNQVINFKTRLGSNPGGSGYIGGKISICLLCKNANFGQPAEGVKVVLMNSSNQPVAFTYTDKNGYFYFKKLGNENYKIALDRPGIDNSKAPSIALSTSNNLKDSLKFTLYPTTLVMETTTAIKNDVSNSDITIYPNPATDVLNIHFNKMTSVTSALLFDILGNQVMNMKIEPNCTDYTFNLNLSPGMYLLKTSNQNGEIQIQKISVR